jgi:hypothetical protein
VRTIVLNGLRGLALASAVAPAAMASQLDIKPGQWQMTTVMHMEGLTIPPEVLARMPPQAQAQVQAMMQSMTQPHTAKSCITDAELQRGFNLNHKMGAKCHQTLANLSSSAMEVSAECQYDSGTSTMDAKFAAVDSSTLQGTVEVNRVSDKGPKHMTVQIDGKWLGAACDGTEESHGVGEAK